MYKHEIFPKELLWQLRKEMLISTPYLSKPVLIFHEESWRDERENGPYLYLPTPPFRTIHFRWSEADIALAKQRDGLLGTRYGIDCWIEMPMEKQSKFRGFVSMLLRIIRRTGEIQ